MSLAGVKDEHFSPEFRTGLGFNADGARGLTRLAIARLEGAGVPVAPLLKNAGLTPEATADSGERLSVQSQIKVLEKQRLL